MAIFQRQIQGLRCTSCAQKLERQLQQYAGIQRVEVRFAQEDIRIEYDAAALPPSQLEQWIEAQGYSLWQLQEALPEQPFPRREMALLLLALPFLTMMPAMLGGKHHFLPAWLQCFLATAAWLLAFPVHQSAWRALRRGSSNMDTLISFGSSVIYLYSCAAWWRGEALYFESTVIMLMVLAWGRYWESKTRRQYFNAWQLLQAMLPAQVQRYRQGQYESITLRALRVGDEIYARAGERLAADGEVVEGQASCYEAHLNGEALPRQVSAGETVLAGALLQHGSIRYRVRALGANSFLGQIMRDVDTAAQRPTRLGSLADRISAYFLPTVLLLALLTFVLQYFLNHLAAGEALLRALSVLLIACPCALGLAAPTAWAVALTAARQRGLWFQDAHSLEKASEIQTLIFDKTGTLTRGEAQLLDTWCAEHIDAKRALHWAWALEQSVHHPYAQAFQTATQEALPEIWNIEYVAGYGLQAEHAAGVVRLGRLDWAGVEPPAAWQQQWQHATWMGLSVGGEAWTAFAVDDAIRVEAQDCIAAAKRFGLNVMILSGDRPEKVAALAQDLGIAEHRGAATPSIKAEVVKRFQSEGQKVAMLGDGINDAPALLAADLGIAMAEGTAIAQHSADLNLRENDLRAVLQALKLARSALWGVRQNVFFALIYNVLAIPLAALGYLSPTWAALAMSLSSLSVLGNALWLKKRLQNELTL